MLTTTTKAASTAPTAHPTETLFDKDGISLRVTSVPPSREDEDEDREGVVLTLALGRHREKNVVNPTMISLLVEALDVADSHPASSGTNNKAMIITGLSPDEGAAASASAAPKFFCNGLDLEWTMRANGGGGPFEAGGESGGPAAAMIERFHSEVLARILVLPFRTVAAVNGHCIGAGLFLALACDRRVMRTERGYVQWPEARLGMRLTKGFAELSKAKVDDGRVLREGILTAKKYGPSEAVSAGIIDEERPVEELYARAFEIAREGLPESRGGMNLEYFDPKGYAELKVELYTDAYRALKFGKVEDLPHSRI
ncbi:hypothetical protein ACHAWF_016938 [Thalassiosira exigua]